MCVPTETVLLIAIAAIIGTLFFLLRIFNEYHTEAEMIDDKVKKIAAKIEVTKTLVQAFGVLGIGITVFLSWYQVAQANEQKFRLETASLLSSALTNASSQNLHIRIAGVLTVEELATQDPDRYKGILRSLIKNRLIELPCTTDNKIADTRKSFERSTLILIADRQKIDVNDSLGHP